MPVQPASQPASQPGRNEKRFDCCNTITHTNTCTQRCSHLLQHCYRHAQSGRNAKRPDCCNTITHTHTDTDAVICCSIAIDMPSPGAMQNDPTVATQSHTHTPIPMQSYAAALLSTCPVRAQCKTTLATQSRAHAHTCTPCSASACSHLLQQALAIDNNQKYINYYYKSRLRHIAGRNIIITSLSQTVI